MTDALLRPDDWDEPVSVPELDALSTIVVPFDGSHSAERALAWGELVAGNAGAEVVVVVAYEPPLTKKGRGAIYVEDMRAALAEEAHVLAEEAVALIVQRGGRARGVVVEGEASAATLDVADTEAAQLIVLGRRGLAYELPGMAGGLERFRSAMGGGVAERVARHAEIAVMVV